MNKLYKNKSPENDNSKIDEFGLQTANAPFLHVLNQKETNGAHHQDPIPYHCPYPETITDSFTGFSRIITKTQ
jgi:hypothetical protein